MTTNLQHLMNAIEKANNEEIMVFENGSPNNNGFIVTNNGKGYNVEVHEGVISGCSCPHHVSRRVHCKHMIKVALTHNLNIKGLGGLGEE